MEPDDKLEKLLDSPRDAFKEFFGDEEKPENVSELQWRNHVFSQKSVIAHLCVWAKERSDAEPHQENPNYLDLLRSLL